MQAESAVAERLAREGYLIVGRNVRVGRLELDIIARKGSLLVVCEVRSRSSDRFGSPVDTIDRQKVARIRRATATWLHEQGLRGVSVRFDAAAVTFRGEEPEVVYYPNAF